MSLFVPQRTHNEGHIRMWQAIASGFIKQFHKRLYGVYTSAPFIVEFSSISWYLNPLLLYTHEHTALPFTITQVDLEL